MDGSRKQKKDYWRRYSSLEAVCESVSWLIERKSITI